ncbi:alpha/beta fold hydrolase [Glycomyces sp. NPDC047010]|uniref:alpha/beta fold hydrolase n=1 Tax=Glycomyces sp. NPDC047010 TaxID=3155023 RepID=UPI0033E86294
MITHYEIDGDGPPLVLVNSLGTTMEMWRPQVTPLGARFRLVRFDNRGHGGTPYGVPGGLLDGASGGPAGGVPGGFPHGAPGGPPSGAGRSSAGVDRSDYDVDRPPTGGDHASHGADREGRGADSPFTVDDLAGDVADLLDHLGIERAHVAGVSLGGAVAMRLAVTRPERVDRLVLISTAARIGTLEGWTKRAAVVRADGCASISGAAMGRWFSSAFIEDQSDTVAAFRQRFDDCDREGYAACCEALGAMDQRADLARIAAPALVVAGTADEVTTPADAAFLDEHLPDSRVLLAEGAKHLLTAERPDWFNRAVVEFLEGDRS